MSKPCYNTPEEAEAAFYQSIENGDIEQMMAVWDRSEDIVCIHPFGQRLEGTGAVERGWSGILSGKQRLRFRVESTWNYVNDGLAVHAVLEHIKIAGDDTEHMPIIATNAYRRTADGWRMVLHHASPQPKLEKSEEASTETERVLH